MSVNLEVGKSTPPSSSPIGRTWIFGVMMTILFTVLLARLAQLQILEHDRMLDEAVKQIHGTVIERDRRGTILDSKGRTLAASIEVKACALDPMVFLDAKGGNHERTLNTLTKLLHLTPSDLQRINSSLEKRRLVKDENGQPEEKPLRFVWVKRRLSDDEWKNLSDAMSLSRKKASEAWKYRRRWLREAGQCIARRDKEGEARAREAADGWRRTAEEAEGYFAGIFFPPEYERIYPQGQLASHILGFGDIDGRGLEGMERLCEVFLKGMPASVMVARDARSHPLSSLVDEGKSTEGMTVELTIDSVVQAVVEDELAKAVLALKKEFPDVTGNAIVMEPMTGDILAIANFPTFDSNNPGKFPARNRRNDVIASVLEPGSTFKPFIVAAALQEKRINLDEELNCATYVMDNGRRIKDIHPFGRMSILMGLVKSSNPAMVQVGLRLGPQLMRSYVQAYGFGDTTGSLIPGELRGKITAKEKWSLYTMGSVPMGYEINVTPIQMATAYCMFANGGWLPRPRLIKSVLDKDGGLAHVVEPEMRRQVLKPEIASTMRNALRKVVTDGTGKRADIPEYSLAGKTGTANMIANARERQQGVRGYSQKRHVANFVALAPYEKPRAVIYVSIRDTGKYGGELAAPVVGGIAKRILSYWGLPPKSEMSENIDYDKLFANEPEAAEAVVENDMPMVEDDVDPRILEDWVEDEEAVG